MELPDDVSVDGAKSVHLGQFLSLDEADLELLELFADLRGHEDDFADRVRTDLVVQLDLLVTGSLDCNANLEISSDFAEILALRVEQGDPLVLDHMLRLEVDRGHVELVLADHFIPEHSFVHHLDADRLHFNLARVLALEEVDKL